MDQVQFETWVEWRLQWDDTNRLYIYIYIYIYRDTKIAAGEDSGMITIL